MSDQATNIDELPTIRWGIIGTGTISGKFVSDIILPTWPGKRANHIIHAVASSSLEKAEYFVQRYLAKRHAYPTFAHGDYSLVYNNPHVDCVYIGTPHSAHKQNCLDAIHAGKPVLCEKPFAMNADEAREVFAAAFVRNVFIMEAVWTRFFPLVTELQRILIEEEKIGPVRRLFCDYNLNLDLAAQPETSRYRDPALGAGSLLDIGIYPVTWSRLVVGSPEHNRRRIVATQEFLDGVEISTACIIHSPNLNFMAVLSSSHAAPTLFSSIRIEGTKGIIVVHGPKPSAPESFTVHYQDGRSEHHDFEKPGYGLYWEADAVAHDIAYKRTENSVMPRNETLRVMKTLDEIRRQGDELRGQQEEIRRQEDERRKQEDVEQTRNDAETTRAKM